MREKLPQWYKKLDEETALVLTNDIDSLASCYVLEQLFGCEIKGFYDFKRMFLSEKPKRAVGVDLDLKRGNCFSNHKTYYKNEKAINLNNVVDDQRYFMKYPFSTLILVLWLYEVDLGQFNDEQLRVILAIDSSYKGFYGDFQWVHEHWLKTMELEVLKDILDRSKLQDFEEVKRKYNLNAIIEMSKDDMKLHTDIRIDKLNELFGIDMKLPDSEIEVFKTYRKMKLNPDVYEEKLKEYEDTVFSNALVSKRCVMMSVTTD